MAGAEGKKKPACSVRNDVLVGAVMAFKEKGARLGPSAPLRGKRRPLQEPARQPKKRFLRG
jgi:hypothetical protein